MVFKYRFSYYAYNQMGEFNDNPHNKKECVFYDTKFKTRLRRSPLGNQLNIYIKIFRIISSYILNKMKETS